MAVFTVIGLAFEGIVGKAYAKTESPATNIALPEGTAFESVATGTSRSADYEIVSIYGRKYIIFSSGGDVEVLEYWGHVKESHFEVLDGNFFDRKLQKTLFSFEKFTNFALKSSN